jgi:hypothetical protein
MHLRLSKDGGAVSIPAEQAHAKVERAKCDLVCFARRHDQEKAARRKPVKLVLLAAGAGLIAARLLLSHGKRRTGIGRRVMGVMFVARVAATHGPSVLRAINNASKAYRAAKAAGASSKPVSYPPAVRTPPLLPVMPAELEYQRSGPH